MIGQSDGQANRPVSAPYTPEHLYGSALGSCFDIGELRLKSLLSDDLIRAVEFAPTVDRLFSKGHSSTAV